MVSTCNVFPNKYYIAIQFQQCEFDHRYSSPVELDQASLCDHNDVYDMQQEDLSEGTMQLSKEGVNLVLNI